MKRLVILVALTAALLPERFTAHLKSPANRSSGRTSRRTLCGLVCMAITLGLAAPLMPLTVAADDEFAGGSGTPEDPYQIANWYHLDNVRGHLDEYFVLRNNINSSTDGHAELAGSSANGGKGWDPIGEHSTPFQGVFDGHGYAIGDIRIDRTDEGYLGLFAALGGDGSIKRLNVGDSALFGGNMVGMIVGTNQGTVESCWTWGLVSAAQNYAGGLVGRNLGNVFNCFNCCTVSAANWIAGGIASESLPEATIAYCYSIGEVSAPSDFGGLLGFNYGSVLSCYWDVEASGVAVSAGGTGKTTSEMQQIETYCYWDILAVSPGVKNPYGTWNIAEGKYPSLTMGVFQIPLKTGWNMVSVPVGIPGTSSTCAEVFGDQIEAIYTWDPSGKCYDCPTVLEPNVGYWVAVTEDKTIICRY